MFLCMDARDDLWRSINVDVNGIWWWCPAERRIQFGAFDVRASRGVTNHKPPAAHSFPSQNVFRVCNSWFHENYPEIMIASKSGSFNRHMLSNGRNNVLIGFEQRKFPRGQMFITNGQQMVRWCIKLRNESMQSFLFLLLTQLLITVISIRNETLSFTATQFYQINANVFFCMFTAA